ncbi:uncharacterized protein MONBRDRAFT_38183 [Monosiga brevicollis MX1]|uniref:Uncharacterized protein n=1 Tax=Monosiga brevicollis TaxID=81824 RepID=A9V662_MONBE|nr:uncharacterized protein MONBRDRAFT_38183 [Monosiga brevicollis MX1]EDQ86934.1 predicted protein [Monosiga brevicollis MX1]|eukprot:XP_001748173.1 hypothetical protein [Monosiga brevicollis MX1]
MTGGTGGGQAAPAHSLLDLLFCTAGIYASYITYGYLQEGLYEYVSPTGQAFKAMGSATVTLLIVQVLLSGLYALITSIIKKDKPMGLGLDFAVPGLTYIGAMLCSNEALKYVNYPTQVLAKSCKLVPVLLVNVLYYGRRPSMLQYLHVALVTVGIILFRWKAGRDSSESNTTYGLLLLAMSLAMDGITGPAQEWIRDHHKPSNEQFMFYCNLYGLVYLLGGLCFMEDGLNGLLFVVDPQNAPFLGRLIVFCICGTIGQNFIFLTLRKFGSLALTTVTTTRKFFTILFSVVAYGHVLGFSQWIGVLVVFIGLSVDAVEKMQKRSSSAPSSKKRR